MHITKLITAQAPVNIAVIKYWGKANEELKIPINDSLSGTLAIEDLCATTTIAVSEQFLTDELVLNGEIHPLSPGTLLLLDKVRSRSVIENARKMKIRMASRNNFPTAAGLASSAAGYACMAYALGQAFGITDSKELSILARIGSGSACRSLFGGFVRWYRGDSSENSFAKQMFDHNHWPEMRVLICVSDSHQKEVSSSKAMKLSVETSELLKYRASTIVPARIEAIIESIRRRNFSTFAELTMQDSNQFHAICQDTWPPIKYMSETSWSIVNMCLAINEHCCGPRVAYTFDAGPNACLYCLDDMVGPLISLIRERFSINDDKKIVGCDREKLDINSDLHGLREMKKFIDTKISEKSSVHGSLSYVICTKIGQGPRIIDTHLEEINLN